MAGVLEQLLKDVYNAPAGERWVRRQVLLDYLHSHHEDDIIREIGMIENVRLLNHLVAAGLSQRMIDAAVRRWREMQK